MMADTDTFGDTDTQYFLYLIVTTLFIVYGMVW